MASDMDMGDGGMEYNDVGNDDDDNGEVVPVEEVEDVVVSMYEGGGDGGSGDADMSGDVQAPTFAPASAESLMNGLHGYRKISVPKHRYTPLENNWDDIVNPVVNFLKLQIRMNIKTRCIELRTSPYTDDAGALQKATDYIRAFLLGFELRDAIALVRMDDLYIDSFDVTDVKPLHGDHLARAIGRIAGKDGKTKFTIENSTKTRLVVAGSRIHILGAFTNIKAARHSVSILIMGKDPSTVNGNLRAVASRLNTRY